MHTIDHREFTRVRTTLPVIVSSSTGQTHGQSRDISLRGCLVELSPELPLGTQVQVRIPLSGDIDPDMAILANGKVVRSSQGASAVSFDELIGSDSYHHLSRLVLYNAENPQAVDAELTHHLGLKPMSTKI